MDSADADFLSHLFKENNKLRSTITNLTRKVWRVNKLHNVTTALEDANIEIKNSKHENENPKLDKKTVGNASDTQAKRIDEVRRFNQINVPSAMKDTSEQKFIIERQEVEITKLNEELAKTRHELNDESEKNETLSQQVNDLHFELSDLQAWKERADRKSVV